jgi:hypothetical protein
VEDQRNTKAGDKYDDTTSQSRNDQSAHV